MNEKPFKCEHCGAILGFTNGASLTYETKDGVTVSISQNSIALICGKCADVSGSVRHKTVWHRGKKIDK